MPEYVNHKQKIYAGDFALYKDKKRNLSYLMPVYIKQVKYLAEDETEISFASLQLSYNERWQTGLEFYYFDSEADTLQKFYLDYLASLKQKADEGDTSACFSYASLCQYWSYHGRSEPIDAMKSAIQYFVLASEAGQAEASYCLADMYRTITNPLYQSCFEPQREKAFQYYLKKSAEQGHALGQYQLAYFNEYAKYGFTQDIAQAVHWYQQSAAQDFPQALNNLGDKYEKAKGVKRDYHKAAMYYQRSADHQIPEAMYNLGRLYLRGLGVEKDQNVGREWLARSAQKYYQPAIRKLRDLDKNL